jgi:two-component system response regulator
VIPEGRTVLLVEDDPDERELAVRAFSQADAAGTLLVATDGEAALAALLAPERPLPDLVLLDMNLPRLDGAEVLRRLRAHERTRLVPVVVLSSSTEDRDVEQSYAAGANGYVRKPVSFTEFVEVSRQLGQYWLGLNRPPPPRR